MCRVLFSAHQLNIALRLCYLIEEPASTSGRRLRRSSDDYASRVRVASAGPNGQEVLLRNSQLSGGRRCL